jgi:hypothetical protein
MSYQDIGYIKDGCLFVQDVPSPRTGVQISFVTPSNMAFEIVSMRCSLSCAGVGVDRFPTASAFALNRRFWDCPCSLPIATGQEINLTWAEGLADNTDFASSFGVPFSRMILPPGTTIELSASNFLATDAFGPLVVVAIAYPLK